MLPVAQQALLEFDDDDARAEIWTALGTVVDRAPTLTDLRAHALHLFAVSWWRRTGREIPTELYHDLRSASMRVLAVQSLLARVRAAVDGPLMLIKGYETALRYPDPTMRPFSDIDLVVPDPPRVFRALIAAGFRPVGESDAYYERLHHLRPLCLPKLPILVELHRRPEWVRWTDAPPVDELLEHAVPSRAGVGGILAPAPAHHALIVAAHSWSGLPLRRIGDVVDAAVLAAEAEGGEVAEWARRWDVSGLWDMNVRMQRTFLGGDRPPLAVRVWGRTALSSRDATVLEQHERRILGAYAVLPVGRALRQCVAQIALEIKPQHGESWSAKLARMWLALRHAFVRRSQHDAELSARRPRN
jgi:hypothetical protein